ncbi:MAG: DUF2769 domain-containing protein [Methanotrichaceae archaeon]
MMNMNNSKKMNEMMNNMPESEKMMMMEKMMGMCMCHDCTTMKSCSMTTECNMPPQKMGLFCNMNESMMPMKMAMAEKMDCMCTTCPVASDMGMKMTSPCMSKK